MYRQLSEENANLQDYVEKENNEKKRLSRNNEELLWLLQTSPHLSPSSSPIHRAFFPSPDIPPYTYSPGPGTPTHSCSPGPCTQSHKVASSAPGTPTLRGSPAARSSPARIPNANTLPRWAVLLNPNSLICLRESDFENAKHQNERANDAKANAHDVLPTMLSLRGGRTIFVYNFDSKTCCWTPTQMSVVSSEWHTITLYNKKHFRFLPYLLPTDKCTSIFLWSGLFFYAICLYYKSPKFWFRMFRIGQEDIYTAKCNFLNFFLTVKLSTFICLLYVKNCILSPWTFFKA